MPCDCDASSYETSAGLSLRDIARYSNAQAGCSDAQPLARKSVGGLDSILTGRAATVEVAQQRVRCVRENLDDADAQIDLHRHRQRIEARPKIADRARDDDLGRKRMHISHRKQERQQKKPVDPEGPAGFAVV